MGCSFSASFVKWGDGSHPCSHFEGQPPLGTVDGASGMLKPLDGAVGFVAEPPHALPSVGLLTRSPPLLCPRTWQCT